ncbi:hypothetical protein OSC27_04015 [Microbacterium sp. STN6]|uniref:hypothetical protein n=1 Tax=Microbacterium sp. STN6 TaxID=2995588 RepID=UPI002260E3C4|nr:hypothetical protein [Microbacterium sp. STN6]MCX7521442.1 hypothetical protein [Microbacterium sp. STN6]
MSNNDERENDDPQNSAPQNSTDDQSQSAGPQDNPQNHDDVDMHVDKPSQAEGDVGDSDAG